MMNNTIAGIITSIKLKVGVSEKKGETVAAVAVG